MPNSWIGTLVVLFVIAAQVIPAILQAIAKKRREQQMREAAEARQAQQIPKEFRTPAPVDRRGVSLEPVPSAPAPTTVRDDLAARRKAQIEQLRNRREGRRLDKSADVNVQTTVRSGGQISTSRPAPIRVADPTPAELRRRQTLSQSDRGQQQQQAQAQQAQQAQQRAARDRAKRQQSAQPAQQTKTSSEAARLDDSQQIAARSRRMRVHELRASLRMPATLRNVMILKELLDKPVGMR